MFGAFGSFFKTNHFDHACEKLEEKKRPAYIRGVTECVRCGYCCWRRPCNLVPSDVNKIAEYLKISASDLFKNYLVVDKIQGSIVIVPARVSQKDLAGGFLPDSNTFDIDTPCIFFAENGLGRGQCKIHKVKPRGGLEWGCWYPDEYPGVTAYRWSEADLKAYFDYTYYAWE